MKAKDTVRATSNVRIEVLDARTGRILSQEEVHNSVGADGLNLIRDLLYGDSVEGIKWLALLDASGNEQYRDAITQRVKDSSQITHRHYVGPLAGNGYTYAGARLVNAASGGSTYAEVSFTGIEKTDSIAISITWVTGWTDDGV